jgi:hypothetical protein
VIIGRTPSRVERFALFETLPRSSGSSLRKCSVAETESFDVAVFRPSPPSTADLCPHGAAPKLCRPVSAAKSCGIPARTNGERIVSPCIHSDRRKSSTACLSLTDKPLKFWITLLASDAANPPLVATQDSPRTSVPESVVSISVDVEKCA